MNPSGEVIGGRNVLMQDHVSRAKPEAHVDTFTVSLRRNPSCEILDRCNDSWAVAEQLSESGQSEVVGNVTWHV
jgi:hypothetical protein